ncbi:hypothetical protein O1363_21660 [Bacteroides fragilis]|nr:hypothetical protein [Bacteroides fragilis]MCZ2660880.1 hypothetical protein [Bacteroides fragilis]
MLPSLKERSDENGWQLEKMEVMPDHVLATPLRFFGSYRFPA